MNRFCWIPSLLLIMLMNLPLRAQDTSPSVMLFTELPADRLHASAELASIKLRENQNPAIIRSRLVEVNFGLLHEGDTEQINLNLFEDAHFLAVREDLQQRGAGRYTWIGKITEIPASQVILVVEGQDMTATIIVDSKRYVIRPLGKATYTIREINQGAFPGWGEPKSPPKPNSNFFAPEVGGANLSASPDAITYVDVLVVYTADAARATSNISVEIQLAIDQTNVAYANSGIHHRLRLVGAAQVAYTETGDMNTDLTRLTYKTDGFMDNVHNLRDSYGADVVSLFVENGGQWAGMAWMMREWDIGSWFEAWAFSVVDREWASSYHVLAHEIGHNMGATHDLYVSSTGDGAYPYSHGYLNLAGRWHTIMSYYYECSDAGVYCNQIPHFSNPNMLYNGAPTGIAEGQPDAADNRKTLNNTASTVAAFRATQAPPTTVKLTSVADAFVRGGSYANKNYGSAAQLPIRKASGAAATREAYIRFDLSSVSGTITAAKVHLLPYDAGSTGQVHNAALVTNDSWGEKTITWNNKPASSTALGSWTVVKGQVAEFDVTAQAQQALSTDKLLSVRIYKPQKGNKTAWVRYGSRENGRAARRPKLILTLSSGAQLQADLLEVQEKEAKSLSSIGPEEPSRFELHQNYPNPFNPTTQIRFALPEAAEVRLVVYDMLGREVVCLVDGAMEAGYHEVTWQATHLPSGVYVYGLKAGSFRQTRTMVLMK